MEVLLKTDNKEGLIKLIGKRVTFFCLNYIYTGDLVGVNEHDVKLENAGIVYETGKLDSKDWKDYQELPHDVYVRTGCIESYMELK